MHALHGVRRAQREEGVALRRHEIPPLADLLHVKPAGLGSLECRDPAKPVAIEIRLAARGRSERENEK